MPRLPGPEAVGNLPSMRPSGSPATISAESPIASGLNRVGAQITQIATQQQERDDALQAAEADAHLTTGLAGLRRQFEQDGDWSTFEPRFQSEAARLRAEASGLIRSEGLRRRWQPRADVAVSGALDSVLSRGRRLQSESEFDRLDTVLGSLSTRYTDAPDDDTRNTIMRNIEDTIELGRRSGIVPPKRLRDLRRRHLQGAIEADVSARATAGDGYAALLELREGDALAQTPSTGQVSDAGLSQIQSLSRRPGQTLTPAEARAEQRRLQTEASRVSRWMGENLVGEDGQRIPLSQLQHDALVAYAMSRVQRAEGRGTPEDVLQELLPTLRTGSWESVSSAIRAGDLTAMEQPASGGAAPAPGGPRVGGPVRRFAPDVDSAIASAAQAHGIDPDLLRRVAAIESGGDPRNVTGSYRGLFQLSAAEFGGRGDIFNAADNANAAAANFVRHIADFRRQNGRDPTAGELYLIHQQGAGGFAAHMAQPGRLAWESMFSTAEGQQRGRAWARQAIAGNLPPSVLARLGGVDNVTSQQFMDYWRSRVEGTTGSPAPSSAPGAPASADPHLSTLGDMVLGQAPSSRYARLPLDRRQAVIRHLSEALRVDMRSEIDSDIESIRRTGRPRTLPDGTTWLQRATRARVFTPHQLATIQNRWREAEALFRGLDGLSDMTSAQMQERLDQLDTSRVPEGGDYAMAARVGAKVRRQAERIEEFRRSDPSRAVSGAYIPGQAGSIRTRPDGSVYTAPDEDDVRIQPAREVMEAYRALGRRYSHLGLRVDEDGDVTVQSSPTAPGQAPRPQRLLLTDSRLSPDDRRLIIESRLAAMERLGVPEDGRFILRADEAASLLSLPSDISTLNPTQFEQRLREASQRAMQLFGPRHARAAFEAAIHFRRLSGDRQQTGQSFTEQLENMRQARLAALDREQALWGGGAPQPGIPGAPMLGPEGWTETTPGGWFSGPGSRPTQSPLSGMQGPFTYTPGFTLQQPGGMEAPTGVPGTGAFRPLQPPSPMPPGRTTPITSAPAAGRWPRPSQDDINALVENPQAAQAEFDLTFGRGAAASYLQIYGRR